MLQLETWRHGKKPDVCIHLEMYPPLRIHDRNLLMPSEGNVICPVLYAVPAASQHGWTLTQKPQPETIVNGLGFRVPDNCEGTSSTPVGGMQSMMTSQARRVGGGGEGLEDLTP